MRNAPNRDLAGCLRRAALAFLLLSIAAPAAATGYPSLEILWRDKASGQLAWKTFDAPPRAKGLSEQVPLGSLWKLFVYLWLVEERRSAPDYACVGPRGQSPAAKKLREEESYCCEAGQRIGQDLALVRSCGLFFEPTRLKIDPRAWRAFWEARRGVREDAPWLAELAAMKPETVVSPASILAALEAAPPRAREETANLLLARLFAPAREHGQGTAELVRRVGGLLRIKTFSWYRPGSPRVRVGGGAGWFADGRAVWFAGEGTGQQVMARQGARLAEVLAQALPPEGGSMAPGCVRVNFFARYPFELELPGGKRAPEGVLRGRFVARFQNVSIPFTSSGELSFTRQNGHPRIEGRFGLDDYVARVIDREADAKETEAARALSVVIRTYLLDKATHQGNCLLIDDSSHRQRVSILPPSAAARAVSGFTTGLTLTGTPVGYHSYTPSENRMAWTQAVAASRAGQPWNRILRQSFPRADLAAMRDPGMPCQRFDEAENWLKARAPGWERTLRAHLPGFEPPSTPHICLLAYGTPFSEQDRGRIYVRGLRKIEDRITLAHEYLHLGLRHHPSGHDEALVEHWARKLIDGGTMQ